MTTPSPTPRRGAAWEVLLAFLWLGLTAFGGPIAHLGYFRRAFVDKRRWLTEEDYADIVALCQFLPGPASSQTGFLIGLRRAGGLGALAAWTGFTLPSAALMTGFALLAPRLSDPLALAAIHGLKLVAVAVVAQAVWGMATRLCTDRRRTAIALSAFAVILLLPSVYVQLAAIVGGAMLGWALCRDAGPSQTPPTHPPIGRRVGLAAAFVFTALLIGLPMAVQFHPGHTPWALADLFYRAGTLVFGGGHVVLPMLRQALVPAGWIRDDAFLAGYGAAQAMPGPLFTFAAFLGGAVNPNWGLIPTALLCLAAIFLPGFLLVLAVHPFWAHLRSSRLAQATLTGVNAAVVGILGAALYSPVATSAIARPSDMAIAVAGFVMLQKWQAPPLAIVVACVAASILLHLGGLEP